MVGYRDVPDKARTEQQSLPGPDGMAHQMSSLLYKARSTSAGADFHDAYTIDFGNVLGIGSFGRVLMGRCKASGRACAVKQISRAEQRHDETDRSFNTRMQALKQEITIMQELEHRNIARFYGHFKDDLYSYIILQLCTGGRVIEFIARTQEYRESDAAFLMHQVFDALGYMHGRKIIHRDVKPDNLLLESWSPIKHNTLKLIDFGLSAHLSGKIRQCCGTPDYMSPQAVDGRYDVEHDMWSCGASLFELLCGYVPFRADTEEGVFEAVKRGNFALASADWRRISDEAKDLVRGLLKMNENERLSARQALEHLWTREMPADKSRGLLQPAIRRFSSRLVPEKRPEAEPAEVNVRSALSEVTSWVNSLLPNSNLWQSSENPSKSNKYAWI